jgi:hypothetical protein
MFQQTGSLKQLLSLSVQVLEGMDSNDTAWLWLELVHGFKNLTQQVTVMLSLSPLLTAEYTHQVFDELQRFC